MWFKKALLMMCVIAQQTTVTGASDAVTVLVPRPAGPRSALSPSIRQFGPNRDSSNEFSVSTAG